MAQQDGGSGYGGQQGQQGQQQNQQGQQQYGQQSQQKADFEDKTIEKFAKAHKKVRDLQEDYSSELQNADDENQARDLQSKYREKIMSVIEENDLGVEKYNEISMAMQRDSDLREKVEDKM
jgi:GTP1/Obg family GTP-binding protein